MPIHVREWIKLYFHFIIISTDLTRLYVKVQKLHPMAASKFKTNSYKLAITAIAALGFILEGFLSDVHCGK